MEFVVSKFKAKGYDEPSGGFVSEEEKHVAQLMEEDLLGGLHIASEGISRIFEMGDSLLDPKQRLLLKNLLQLLTKINSSAAELYHGGDPKKPSPGSWADKQKRWYSQQRKKHH